MADNKKYFPNEDEDFYFGKTSVSLEFYVEKAANYEEFCRMWSDEMLDSDVRIGSYLRELLDKYDKNKSTVSEDAFLATAYVGNVVNGHLKNPDRDALISICFAIGATFEETQKLLKYAGHQPLYVRRKRDVIIWFGLTKGQSLCEVDDAIIRNGLAPIINPKNK